VNGVAAAAALQHANALASWMTAYHRECHQTAVGHYSLFLLPIGVHPRQTTTPRHPALFCVSSARTQLYYQAVMPRQSYVLLKKKSPDQSTHCNSYPFIFLLSLRYLDPNRRFSSPKGRDVYILKKKTEKEKNV